MMNNMFDQFIPMKFLSMPLTLMGSTMALLWLWTTKKSHWLQSRNLIMQLLSQLLFNKFFNTKKQKLNQWTKWFIAMFLLCFSFKMFSLIPYSFSQTSHLSFTLSLSLPLWITFQLTGIIHNWKKKMSHLVPQGTPPALIPAMMIMETLSLLMQPLTLGFRLGANLLAGHLLMFLCSCVVWEATKTSILGMTTMLLLFLLFILEIAVACMQAAVFIILSKSYLEEKIK